MALAEPTAAPTPEPFLAAPRIRRCTFRRITAIERTGGRSFDVECVYPDRSLTMPMGDLENATLICNACVATGVFRADED